MVRTLVRGQWGERRLKLCLFTTLVSRARHHQDAAMYTYIYMYVRYIYKRVDRLFSVCIINTFAFLSLSLSGRKTTPKAPSSFEFDGGLTIVFTFDRVLKTICCQRRRHEHTHIYIVVGIPTRIACVCTLSSLSPRRRDSNSSRSAREEKNTIFFFFHKQVTTYSTRAGRWAAAVCVWGPTIIFPVHETNSRTNAHKRFGRFEQIRAGEFRVPEIIFRRTSVIENVICVIRV